MNPDAILRNLLKLQLFNIYLDPLNYRYHIDVYEHCRIPNSVLQHELQRLRFRTVNDFTCSEKHFWQLGQQPQTVKDTLVLFDVTDMMKVLKYLFSHKVQRVSIHEVEMSLIINNCLHTDKDILQCVDQLLDAGYENLFKETTK